jgi:hypothetical protein
VIEILRAFIRECSAYESSCKAVPRKYADELKKRRNIYTRPDKIKKDERIIDCKKMELIVQVLYRPGYTLYPFIIQCIAQGCWEHFRDSDELKSHLHREHKCHQDMLEKYEVYAISQMYDVDFV